MKNIRQHFDDLRPEYSRSDFGEIVKGKHAYVHLEVAEFVRLLIVCIGEDEALSFIHHSHENSFAGRRPGDWTYELDSANQINLRYWISEFRNISESISNPTCVTSPQERADLQALLTRHVQILKTRVAAL